MSKREPATEQSILRLISLILKLEAHMSAQVDALMAQNAALSSALNSVSGVMNQLIAERAVMQTPAATPEELQKLAEANAALLGKAQTIAANAAQALINSSGQST